MKVVRVRPDRSVEVIGTCADFDPPKRPGDFIETRAEPAFRLGDPLPFALVEAAHPVARFRCILIGEPAWPRRFRGFAFDPVVAAFYGPPARYETAVEIEPSGPSPEWLPEWRAAT